MPRETSAAAPIIEGKQYHINCGPGDISRYVLIPGDPGRVNSITSVWEEAREVANHREYHSVTGVYGGAELSCVSSGIGSPSLAIAIDELCRIGADTFIRVGSCGGLRSEQKIGDLVISTGAVRLDGTSRDFVIPEYPAVAHYEVVMALIQAAEELHERYHVGTTAATDSFYAGQGRLAYNNYLPSHKEHILEDMQKAGVQNFEMESGCLFTLAGLFGKRAGTVCCIVAHRVTDEFEINDEMQIRAGRVASRAVTILSEWDALKKKNDRQFLYPAMFNQISK